MRAQAANTSTIVLSPEKFEALWLQLEDGGFFSLPVHSSDQPPEGQPYVLVDTGDDRRIYVRPEGGGQSSDDFRDLLRIWSSAKLLVVRTASAYY